MITTPVLKPLSVYIHIPWCTKKCPYCDFNSHTALNNIREKEYTKQLVENFTSEVARIKKRPISSIFIGGGTPSLFTARSIDQILNHIIDTTDTCNDIEITMEANPGSLTPEYCKALKQTPVNRLSIGVQSFNNQHLKTLGRIHDEAQAHQAITAALDAGFQSINLDIMHGLPGQTLSQGLLDLHKATQYPIPHLSWYQLTIEPNTLFHHHPPTLPEHDAIDELQQQGQAHLTDVGFQQYEISAYCKNNQACQHNMNYWLFGDYLGIGAGAHGKITDPVNQTLWRYANYKHPKRYLDSHHHFYHDIKSLSQHDIIFDYLLNTLRLQQPISLQHFEQCSFLPRQSLIEALKNSEEKELVICQKNAIAVTALGRRFINDILSDIV